MNSSQKTNVHWLCWQPTPYNNYLFNHVSVVAGLDLTVHYRASVVTSHPWRESGAILYRNRTYDEALKIDWHLIRVALKESGSVFVVGGWDHLTSIVIMLILFVAKRPYILWTDTPNISRERSEVFGFMRELLVSTFLKGATFVMTTGTPGMSALKEMKVPSYKVRNLPFFHDLGQFPASVIEARDFAGGYLRIVSSGRIMNRVKGHDVALKALARFHLRHPGFAFEYVIAGTGDDAPEILRLAHELGIDHRVRLLGWIEADAVVRVLLEAHVLIHPSPVHDPFPNAVLEGMAAGLVVFGSDVSGSALDRIIHGVNGFIHKAGNSDQLADQLEVLCDPGVLGRVSREARRTAEGWPVIRGVELIKALTVECSRLDR